MKKNKIFIFLILTLLVLTAYNPIVHSYSVKTNTPPISQNISGDSNVDTLGKTKMKLAVCRIKKDGSFNFTIKEVLTENYKQMIHRLTERLSTDTDAGNQFENILETFKDNNLVSDTLTLQEIFESDILTEYNTTTYNLSIMEPFMAHFSPIFIVGMGFGAGIGDKIGLLTGNVFSLGVIGLGGVFCMDPFAKTIYVQYTFTFPLLLHILSGFAGIMMFPVNFNFISSSGFPFAIYSNFIAFGISGLAIGIPIPSS